MVTLGKEAGTLESWNAGMLGCRKAVGWALAHQLTLSLVGQGPPYLLGCLETEMLGGRG